MTGIMSDNVPLRTQQSCTEDQYYMIDVFSSTQPATNGGTGSLKQLVMYITRALEDSGRLDLLQVRRLRVFHDRASGHNYDV